tara:strand:+ start:1263 stop:1433 length:171 start_codon:yes stop_codon:yes gene_type:complete
VVKKTKSTSDIIKDAAKKWRLKGKLRGLKAQEKRDTEVNDKERVETQEQHVPYEED